jgi:glycosyltransferase involved in cell wall biosynthesis
LFLAIAAVNTAKVQVYLVVPADLDAEVLNMMLPVQSGVIVVRTNFLRQGHPLWWLWRALRKLFNTELIVRPLVRRHRLDIISHSDFVRGTGATIINWLPDFQHVHLPSMFDDGEIASRAWKYVNLTRCADKIVVSSADAQRDLLETQPDAQQKVEILRFISCVPDEYFRLDEADESKLLKKYQLEPGYFYVPNQFWKHKNHLILLDAIRLVKKKNVGIQIVCSGSTNDPRNPTYYEDFLAQLLATGAVDSIRILGIIPYEDVFGLIRFSCSVVNPSCFEGWSSTVEECKSVGKRMILSDIPVHREQLPEAQFFNANNSFELANLLETALSTAETSPLPGGELLDVNMRRLSEYGSRYLEIIEKAVLE